MFLVVKSNLQRGRNAFAPSNILRNPVSHGPRMLPPEILKIPIVAERLQSLPAWPALQDALTVTMKPRTNSSTLICRGLAGLGLCFF